MAVLIGNLLSLGHEFSINLFWENKLIFAILSKKIT